MHAVVAEEYVYVIDMLILVVRTVLSSCILTPTFKAQSCKGTDMHGLMISTSLMSNSLVSQQQSCLPIGSDHELLADRLRLL